MFCTNCGNKLPENANFCTSCGNKVVRKTKEKKSKKKLIIVSMLSLIILLLVLSIILINPFNNKRTIMLYIDGSNLESESGIITTDLAAINPKEIDLDNVNILVYTGGTEKWLNDYISNEENAIFKLTEKGFEKIETYEKKNMGDPDTLTSFLEYGYKNYKAKHYNLVLYDHGGAIDGAIYDDFTKDNLSLEDFEIALKNSPFNKHRKFDSVIFRTCLNGTLEVANIFVDYSKYLVFSEEISYGSSFTDVLSFINKIEKEDNGYNVGKKFIDQYQIQMSYLDRAGKQGVTYSIVDLSKVEAIVKELDKFISGIDLDKNYRNISKIRANMYQYASGSNIKSYDTVDLYTLVSELDEYSTVDGNELLKKIEDALVYNYTNMNNSKGISIYFPYNGSKKAKERFLSVYKKLDISDKYRTFINSFYAIQTNSKGFGFNLKENEHELVDDGKEVSFKLTDEQYKNYSYGRYIVLERDNEHPNYFYPIYSSNDLDVSKDGVLKTKIGNNLISTYDESINDDIYIPVIHRNVDGIDTWFNGAFLYNKSKEVTDKGFSYGVNAYYIYEDGKPKLYNAKVSIDNDERLIGSILNLDDFDDIEILISKYRMLDDNGEYTDEWEQAPELLLFNSKISDLDLKSASLKDGEYYVVFYIDDIYQNTYNSGLIKVGE